MLVDKPSIEVVCAFAEGVQDCIEGFRMHPQFRRHKPYWLGFLYASGLISEQHVQNLVDAASIRGLI